MPTYFFSPNASALPTVTTNDASTKSGVFHAPGKVAFNEGGMPVYKIGYDKFLSFIPSNSCTLSIKFSERKGPESAPTGKQVTLTLAQFLKLYGLVLTGSMQRDDKTMHALGDGFFFQWSSYKGREVATVRRFVTLSGGSLVPLKRDGISFGATTYDTLVKMFREMNVLRDVVKFNRAPDCPLPGMDSIPTADTIVHLLYRTILQYRVAKCPLCTLNPEVSIEPHDPCPAGLKHAVFEEEMKVAEWDVRVDRKVEGYLLWNAQATARQVLDMVDSKLMAYFDQNRTALMEEINKRIHK